MIGGINIEMDFCVFLTGEEIELLDTKTLEGAILDFVEETPHPLKLSVYDIKTAANDLEHLNRDVFLEGYESGNYRVFISRYYFDELKKTGHTGGMDGFGKADILEMSYAEADDDFKGGLRFLKEYFRHHVLPGNFSNVCNSYK